MPGVVVRRLQHEGQPAQPRVADNPDNGLGSDGPLPDFSMAVLPGSAGVQAVVDMYRPQALQADHAVKFRQNAL